MNKPVIGIMPIYYEKMNIVWVRDAFTDILLKYNAVPLLLPRTNNTEALSVYFDICDGFLLTGGHDVNPELYGEQRTEKPEFYDLTRDEMEGYIVNGAVLRDLPILAICRGMQFLNVHYGGTLYYDINSEFDTNIKHPRDHKFHGIAHNVTIVKGTPLYDIIDKVEYGVNSFHHQAIKHLANPFRISAVSEDGLIEGIFSPERRFILGVQWHPELMIEKDEASRKLFKTFVEACCDTKGIVSSERMFL